MYLGWLAQIIPLILRAFVGDTRELCLGEEGYDFVLYTYTRDGIDVRLFLFFHFFSFCPSTFTNGWIYIIDVIDALGQAEDCAVARCVGLESCRLLGCSVVAIGGRWGGLTYVICACSDKLFVGSY